APVSRKITGPEPNAREQRERGAFGFDRRALRCASGPRGRMTERDGAFTELHQMRKERQGGDDRGRETREQPASRRPDRAPRLLRPALVLLGSQTEPDRVGELLLCDGKGPFLFGRFDPEISERLLRPLRQRPGSNEIRPPLEVADHVSRKQLRLTVEGDRLLVTVT